MGARVTAVDIGFKEALVRDMGADEFIDYTKTPITESAGHYDVIFDMVPHSSYSGLIRMPDTGRVRPIVDTVYPMEQAAHAHRSVETGKRLGAIAIAIGDRGAPV